MLRVPGKICPQCGWNGAAGMDEAIVYLRCPECNTEWFDEEARLSKRLSFANDRRFSLDPSCVGYVKGMAIFASGFV